MDWMARAKLYGQAVQILDECIGERARIAVMKRFAEMAGPMQQRGMKDPWEVISRAALAAGIDPFAVEALRFVYLMRTDRWEEARDWSGKPSEQVWEYLQRWGVWDEFEARRRRR